MNYRITDDFVAPFRVYPFIEDANPTQIEVIIKVRADLAPGQFGANVAVTVPMPLKCNGVSCRLDSGATAAGQSAEYRPKDSEVVWTLKKFQGGAEHALRVKIDLKESISAATRREIGPVSLSFEIPMFNVSPLQVKYLRIVDQGRAVKPHRWVRYVTQSSSYVCRF